MSKITPNDNDDNQVQTTEIVFQDGYFEQLYPRGEYLNEFEDFLQFFRKLRSLLCNKTPTVTLSNDGFATKEPTLLSKSNSNQDLSSCHDLSSASDTSENPPARGVKSLLRNVRDRLKNFDLDTTEMATKLLIRLLL